MEWELSEMVLGGTVHGGKEGPKNLKNRDNEERIEEGQRFVHPIEPESSGGEPKHESEVREPLAQWLPSRLSVVYAHRLAEQL